MRVGVHCKLADCGDTRLWVADLLELDAGELMAAKKNTRSKLSKTLESRGQGVALVADHPMAAAEDWKLLRDLADACLAEAVTVKLEESYLADLSRVNLALESIHRWKSEGENPPQIFVDPGPSSDIPSGLPLALDPFLAEDPSLSPYWRVVTDCDVKELSKIILMDLPDWVILAHNGSVDALSPLKARLF